ncbi:MAG: glycosyltransferase [Candidatus Aenigmarchaeota archaeon]|nr:glycosyltransferase [Candidatus Aenigmarchaeota archaeon]
MKILQVNVDGWLYGRPVYVSKLTDWLVGRGVDCQIVGASGSFEKELEKNNIRNLRIFHKWKPLDRSLRSIINLYRIVKNERPDMVHSHGITENIVMGIIGPLLNIPVVATYHTNPFDKYKYETSIKRKVKRYLYELSYIKFLTKRISRNFAYITVISQELKKNFLQRGYKEDKIKVVYFGVDVKDNDIKFKLKRRGEINILFVGRVSEEKGCDYLLRACKRIADQGKTFKLSLIGDGDIDRFSDMAVKMGIGGRVLFAGFRRAFSNLLGESDIFVLPSMGEGLPISILEAMAQGLPVIASNVGGVPEIIDEGVNGYLVPPGDEISLADAMVRMIDKGNRGRYVMGLKNKEKIVQLFSSERMIEDYSDIYKNVLMIDS